MTELTCPLTDKAGDLTGKTEPASLLSGSQGTIQSQDLEDFHEVLTYEAGMQQEQGKTDTPCTRAWRVTPGIQTGPSGALTGPHP